MLLDKEDKRSHLLLPGCEMYQGFVKACGEEWSDNRVVKDTNIRDDSDVFYTMPNRDREYSNYLRGAGVAAMAKVIAKGEPVDNCSDGGSIK